MLERIKEPKPTNLTAEAMQVGAVRVGLLSWRRLLDALKEAVKDEHGLRRAATRWPRPQVRDGRIHPTHARRHRQPRATLALAIASLVPDIVDGAVKAGTGHGSTGRYVSFPRARCWLGLNHGIGSKHGRDRM